MILQLFRLPRLGKNVFFRTVYGYAVLNASIHPPCGKGFNSTGFTSFGKWSKHSETTSRGQFIQISRLFWVYLPSTSNKVCLIC